MASKLSTMLQGSDLIIKIGERTLAYGSSLSFNEDFANQVIGAIGSSGPLALEPTSTQGGSGSFTITRYAIKDAPKLAAVPAATPAPTPPPPPAGPTAKDNSFYSRNSFSPARILLDSTFDIIVKHKRGKDVEEYKLVDCLLSGYDISFSAGGISSESFSFECRLVIDPGAEPSKQ